MTHVNDSDYHLRDCGLFFHGNRPRARHSHLQRWTGHPGRGHPALRRRSGGAYDWRNPFASQGIFPSASGCPGKSVGKPGRLEARRNPSATEPQVAITIEGREVKVRAWRYNIPGLSGHQVPIYFLDTALPENSPWDQTLTDHLYGGDNRYRFCQEVVLGMGGMAILTALGTTDQVIYHMNEGHSALLALSLLEAQHRGREGSVPAEAEVEAVRRHCVFTTHTPVLPAMTSFPGSW